MEQITIQLIIQSFSGLLGAIIGFYSSYYFTKKQNEDAYKREKQLLIRNKREEVYLQALQFMQDYQIKHSNSRKIGFTNEEIHAELYLILSKLNIYASDKVLKVFKDSETKIKNNRFRNAYKALADAIREELEIK